MTNLHSGFVVEDIVAANIPTCLAFLPDGSFLVGEKSGRVYRVTNGVKQVPPLWDGEAEVLNAVDCGLMSIAVDPGFASNRTVYFLYVVDPDTNNVDIDGHGFGRLTRYQLTATHANTLDPASRTILMGVDRSHGPLVGFGSHTVGSLRWGADGSLLVSIGDGGTAGGVDAGGLDPGSFGPGRADPAEDIGAFRAQDLNSLCGKILRLDPATGHGRGDNPYFDGDPASDRSKVWQYGLRNPFRFSVRPGTGSSQAGSLHPGTLYIGDVGWTEWEEVSVARNPGMNLGWPCFEGPFGSAPYQAASPAHSGCATPGSPENPALPESPTMFWTREDPHSSEPSGLVGNCAMDGTFYTGDNYPTEFQGAYFFSDFGESWLKAARFDAEDRILSLVDFASVGGIVDFAADPLTGDLHFVSILDGRVRRIRYVGPDNQRPVAVASAGPVSGRAPLTVSFTSTGSFDPDGASLAYEWNFGDGGSSAVAAVDHAYAGGGDYLAVLTVRDSAGWIDRDTVDIAVSGPKPFPATVVLDGFDRADGPMGEPWTVTGDSPAVNDSTTAPEGDGLAIWTGPVLGEDQEVFLSWVTPPTSGSLSLVLKAQGTSLDAGGIEIEYSPLESRVTVVHHAPEGGSTTVGTLDPVVIDPGDRWGARTYADGVVHVLQNDLLLEEFTLGSGSLVGLGGRPGFGFDGATGARLDDFGAGTLYEAGANALPVAVILAPEPLAFYGPGDIVWLAGSGVDAEDPDSVLAFEWRVDLYHNNHVHPAFFVSNEPNGFFHWEDHDDGTGVWYQVTLTVTDLGGGQSEARADLYPEVDLMPSMVGVTPTPAGSADPLQLEFVLRNQGRSAAQRSRWVVLLDSVRVAVGDTVVGRSDSVKVTVALPAGVPPGIRTLTVIADTLEEVVETDEINNLRLQSLIVVPGSGPDVLAPGWAEEPVAEPHGVFAWVRFTIDEPAFAVVRFGATLPLGDSVVTPIDTTHAARLEGLELGSRYFFQAVATDPSGNASVAPLDSFVTQSGPLDAAGVLPVGFWLSPAMPNPTRGGVRFALGLPHDALVEVRVFDVSGRQVWSDLGRPTAAGNAQIEWPGRTAAGTPVRPGIYLAHVRTAGHRWIRRVVVIH